MEQMLDPRFLLGALKRRWLLIVAPVVLIGPLVTLVAMILPATYQSTARIIVESPQIPESLAQSTVQVGVAERVALIDQRLMTRSNLLEIAARYNVTAALGPMSPTDIVEHMRRATSIRGVRFTGDRGPVAGVNIAFTADRPDLAARVANEFLERLLEQNVRQRTGRALQTSDYFRQETARLSTELANLEAETTRFKIANERALPESLTFRRQELARLQQQVFDRELQVVDLQEQKKQIVDALQRGDFERTGRELSPEEQELERLKVTLVRQRSTYSANHPTVRSLETRISALETRVAEQLRGLAVDTGADAEPGGVRNRVAAMLEELDKQIARISLRREEEETRIAELESSIEATPGVELELSRLDRQLGALQTQYREAVLKLAQAETGERLEVTQQAERFEVIERAEPPPQPTAPNRPVIVAAGFAGSLGLGLALAALAELMNRSVRSAADLERLLDLRPVVSVPYIRTAAEARRQAWLVRLAVLLVVIVIPAGLYAVDQFYAPLPLLAQRLTAASGLDRLIMLLEARFGF